MVPSPYPRSAALFFTLVSTAGCGSISCGSSGRTALVVVGRSPCCARMATSAWASGWCASDPPSVSAHPPALRSDFSLRCTSMCSTRSSLSVLVPDTALLLENLGVYLAACCSRTSIHLVHMSSTLDGDCSSSQPICLRVASSTGWNPICVAPEWIQCRSRSMNAMDWSLKNASGSLNTLQKGVRLTRSATCILSTVVGVFSSAEWSTSLLHTSGASSSIRSFIIMRITLMLATGNG
ncbi:hypothetical protein PybrP1_004748 [[Pythium] brassicae (nom. inval.)]|nr:hypothetical protein PybrP1_004748 [[Pythium] brassicae (nom. inval.)]